MCTSFCFRLQSLRMSAPLCDAVTGRNDSQALLTQLEQANLFLFSLDDEQRWYRYHHLFGDLLKSRLKRPSLIQGGLLHQRASTWYAAEHDLENTMPTPSPRRTLSRLPAL